MKRLWIPILFLFIANAAFAATSALDKFDPRLDKKVTLEASHIKLEDVVNQLSEQSAVTIKAGSGKRDWKVRERRVTIQAKDVRLGDLMEQISKLLNFHLSRDGKEGEWTYLFWQDLKSRTLEEELRAAGKEAADERIRKMRGEDTIAAAEDALKLTPEEALKKRETDPMAAYLGGTKSGRGLANLFSYINRAFPIERNQMLRGKDVSIPISSLPPAMQQAVADVMSGGLATALQKINPKFANQTPHKIVINAFDEMYEQQQFGMGGMMGVIGRSSDGWYSPSSPYMVEIPTCSSDSKISKLLAEALISLEEGKDINQATEQLGKAWEDPNFLAESIARESKTEKNPPTDPELTREVELDKTSDDPNWYSAAFQTEDKKAWIEELSKTFERPIVFESFNRLPPLGLFVKPGKQPVYKILIGLEKAGYSWEYKKGMFRIRPQDWALLRSYQIPESFIIHYEKLLEKQGSFVLDDIGSAVASLTDDQADHYYEELDSILVPTLPMPPKMERSFVRLYKSLSPKQKEMLMAEDGIPFGQLSDRQRQVVGDMIVDELGDVNVMDGSVFMSIRHGDYPDPEEDQPKPPATEEEKARQDIARYMFHFKVWIAGEKDFRSIYGDIRIIGPKYVALIKKSQDEREKQKAEEKVKQQPISSDESDVSDESDGPDSDSS